MSREERAVLVLIAEQRAIPMDQLGDFLGVYGSDALRVAEALDRSGWARVERLVSGEPAWVWLRPAGMRGIRKTWQVRKPRLRGLSHIRGINEARLRVEASGVEMQWVCEAQVRSELGGNPRTWIPDAVVRSRGEEHAIEVELSRKREEEVEAKVRAFEARYDRVVYFASPEVAHFLAAMGLEEREKVVVRQLAEPRRWLDSAAWVRPGDARAWRRRRDARPLGERELKLLEAIGEQRAMPAELVERYMGVDASVAGELVERLVSEGYVKRAHPEAGGSAWLWLGIAGARATKLRLSASTPRIGALDRLRAEWEVRLLVEGRGEVKWTGRRELRQAKGRYGSLPAATVEVDGERHAIDVWMSRPEDDRLRLRLEQRLRDHDAVVWFYGSRAAGALEQFASAARCGELVVRPLPGCKRGRRGYRRVRKASGSGWARPRSREELLWDRLRQAPKTPVRPIVVTAVPEEARRAVGEALAVEEPPEVRAAWKSVRSGLPVYRLELYGIGAFRVIKSGWGWRADAVRDEAVFELVEGEPIDPGRPRPRRGGRYVEVKPKRMEVEAEVWEQVRPLIPPVEERGVHPGRKPLADELILSGVVWVVRNRSPWNKLPRELGYGTDQAVRTRLRLWEAEGVWEPLREALRRLLPDGAELDWDWVLPRGAGNPHRKPGG